MLEILGLGLIVFILYLFFSASDIYLSIKINGKEVFKYDKNKKKELTLSTFLIYNYYVNVQT